MKFFPMKNLRSIVPLPLFSEKVPAGFPSPAADYIDKPIDLNELLVSHPSATYFVRVAGDSMTGAGIFDGSLLVVDSSLRAKHGDIVIANLSGEFTVKRLMTTPAPHLRAENPAYPTIPVDGAEELEIFGVVRFVINEAQ